MKKRLAVLLILLLCLPALAQAYTGSYGGSTLFTFSYDSGRFRMDQDSYLGGNRSNQVWFFMLYDSDYTIDCGMFVNESTQSMSNGDTSALSLYLAATMRAMVRPVRVPARSMVRVMRCFRCPA